MSHEKKGGKQPQPKTARRPIPERLDEMQRQVLSMSGERTPDAAALRPQLMTLALQIGDVLREAEGLAEKGLEQAT